ncbi:formyltransferase family protein [Candidatus Methylopumilus planktonicus]|uniref:formyltransferase family protein n=1 Tax=Candidatus Methylopumilus planktonicus TaxID=1581557 RepID=UPI003BEF34A6
MIPAGGILILLGYDYIDALEELVIPQDVYVVIRQNDAGLMRLTNIKKLRSLMGHRLLISENAEQEILRLINKHQFFCMLTLGWRKLIQIDIFKSISFLINVHPALLPEYKGYHPVPYVLLNNESLHGITAHLITNEIDAGDIVLKKEFPITTFSTLMSLQFLVNKEMPFFMKRLISLIRSESLKLIKNNSEQTKVVAKKRHPEDSEVFLDDSVELMFRKVKASDPERFPSYFVVDGQRVYIKLSRAEDIPRDTEFDI